MPKIIDVSLPCLLIVYLATGFMAVGSNTEIGFLAGPETPAAQLELQVGCCLQQFALTLLQRGLEIRRVDLQQDFVFVHKPAGRESF